MTIADVQERLEKIRANAWGDCEAARSDRDQLYEDVLRFIATGGNEQDLGPFPGKDYADNVELAREALKAEAIKLRWEACA